MREPLVSVICLCYNQGQFVEEAIASVLSQSYPSVELIVVDDASQDDSVAVIEKALRERPRVPFIVHKENKGNCYSFNEALKLADGEYVVDLAADDLLAPDRLKKQVAFFETLPPEYGAVFSDALLVNEQGRFIGTFYKRDRRGKLAEDVPSGDVYERVIGLQVICAPTMTMRRTMLESIDGYDEALSYEDYDLWVRSSRNWLYAYQDEALTSVRLVRNSHGQGFLKRKRNTHLQSTLAVCRKAQALNRTPLEDAALAVSVRYHMRQALFHEAYGLCHEFGALLRELVGPLPMADRLTLRMAEARAPVYWPYRLYRNLFRPRSR